jgi:hypothetical protein
VNRFSYLPIVVTLLFIATIVKFLFDLAEADKPAWDAAQHSIISSRIKGFYVCPVQATPRTFQWNGTTISFQEIWIERRVHTDHPYIWLWRTTLSGGDYLCFTISPKHLITGPPFSPFFVCDEGDFGGGVTWENDGVVFYSWLKPGALAQHSANLKLVKNWDDPYPASIKLTW